jgi:hypothetical protein
MSPLAFFEQLAETPWSMALHESDIAYSILESTHVWSLVLFFGLVIVFDPRLTSACCRPTPGRAIMGVVRVLELFRPTGDEGRASCATVS